LFGTANRDIELLELPADLCELNEGVCELKVQSMALHELPEWMSELTHLETLCLDGTDGSTRLSCKVECTAQNSVLRKLPSSLCDLQALKILTLMNFNELGALPASIGRLTSLETLRIRFCGALQELPESVGTMAKLRTLELYKCALTDVPSSIESLTALRSLTFGIPLAVRQDSRAVKTLAYSLPALRLLQHLNLHGLGEDNVLTIGRSLKAWPLPPLDSPYDFIGLKSCWQALALPPEASVWSDAAIMQHWRVQQHKVEAFASGLHARMGAASQVSSLNVVVLVLIADEVLGGWSLLKLWQRERLAREGAPAPSLD